MRYLFYLLISVFLIACSTKESVINTTSISKKPIAIIKKTPVTKTLYINPSISRQSETRLKKEQKLQEERRKKSVDSNIIAIVHVKKKTPKKAVKQKTPNLIKEPSSDNNISKVSNAKVIIGRVEPVRLTPSNKVLNARIDTGATTTSLNALDIQVYTQDSREFIRFRIDDNSSSPRISTPIFKWVKIKRHEQEPQRRPVIKMRITLGDVEQVTEITLTDRTKFSYPLLIGRNYLRNNYIVDVSKKQTSSPKIYKK